MVDVSPQGQLLWQMMRIRGFEERSLEEFSKGNLFGTTHTCIGQEADCVGVIGALKRSDIVFSNHRGHGHYLAHGGSMRALAAELMGRQSGASEGRGGSQHLHFESFYSNGVQGGIVPNAVGIALAEKLKRSGVIAVVFLGDGTLGEGVVYESLNMAALWGVPLLFVLENNRFAQTTPIELNLSGSIKQRFEAFNIPTKELETTDVEIIRGEAVDQVAQVRAFDRPRALVLHTYRFSPHSKGDDIRSPEEIEPFKQRDPLLIHGTRVDQKELLMIKKNVEDEVEEAFAQAMDGPWPDPEILRNPAVELSKK